MINIDIYCILIYNINKYYINIKLSVYYYIVYYIKLYIFYIYNYKTLIWSSSLYIFRSVWSVSHTDVQQLISVSLKCECAGTESPVTHAFLQLIVVSWGVSVLLLVTRVRSERYLRWDCQEWNRVVLEPLLRHQLFPDPLIWAAYQSREKCAPH